MSCLMYGDQAIAGLEEETIVGTVTAGTKAHMGSKTSVLKKGNIYYVNIVIITDASLAQNETLAVMPFNLEDCYMLARRDTGEVLMLNVINGTQLTYQLGSIPSGSIIRIGATVIK